MSATRLLLTLILIATQALLTAGPAFCATQTDAPGVVVTSIRGELADAMGATLGRAIDLAEREHAAYLIVEIDTPGGAITTMELLAGKLDKSAVEPIAYVTHEALSAGAFLALAGKRIYTNEQAQIGSSLPIFVIPGLGVVPPDMNKSLQDIMEKQMSALRSKFRNRAERHDRPGMAALAEAMVDPSLEVLLVAQGRDEIPMTRQEYDDAARTSGAAPRILRTIVEPGQLLNLTSREAFDLGLTDGVVASRAEVLEALGMPDAVVREVRPNWSERMVGGLEGARWWLIGAGVLLLIIEFFFAPGMILPGALGAACLAIVLFSNYLTGLAELPEILLIFLGIMLLAIEILVIPGFGVTGISGIVCIAVGLLFSFLPFLIPDQPVEMDLLQRTLRNLALSFVGTLTGAMLVSRVLVRRTPFFYRRMVLDPATTTTSGDAGSADLVDVAGIHRGDSGSAITDLRPAGRVQVGDQVVEARTDGDFVGRGRPVVVVSVAPGHVVVRAGTPAGPGAVTTPDSVVGS